MSRRAWAAALASAVVAAVLVGTATGAGPWPGLAASLTDAHGVIYLAKQAAQATIVTAPSPKKLSSIRMNDIPLR